MVEIDALTEITSPKPAALTFIHDGILAAGSKDQSIQKTNLVQRKWTSLTPTASLSWDVQAAPYAYLSTTINVNMNAVTNAEDGGSYYLMVKVVGATTITVTYNASVFKFNAGTPSNYNTANERVIINFRYESSTMVGHVIHDPVYENIRRGYLRRVDTGVFEAAANNVEYFAPPPANIKTVSTGDVYRMYFAAKTHSSTLSPSSVTEIVDGRIRGLINSQPVQGTSVVYVDATNYIRMSIATSTVTFFVVGTSSVTGGYVDYIRT